MPASRTACLSVSSIVLWCKETGVHTSQMPALLQMVHALPPVALVHLVPHQSRHHALDPLLSDNGVLCRLESCVVIVVDALEGRSDLGLLRKERLGLGGRHGDSAMRTVESWICVFGEERAAVVLVSQWAAWVEVDAVRC